MPTEKAVVIYSGGMDSFTLLHQVMRLGYEVHALSFNYGQRHVKELLCAKEVCAAHGLTHKVVDITELTNLLSDSALTSAESVPEGHYTEEVMRRTVVPSRNLILLSIAAGYAVNIGARDLFYGAHAGDHAIYPDCRQEFVEATTRVLEVANYEPVTVHAPFIDLSKGQILAIGRRDMDLDYSGTWTCYNGRERACGKCGACIERLEAFAELGEIDPLEYEADEA